MKANLKCPDCKQDITLVHSDKGEISIFCDHCGYDYQYDFHGAERKKAIEKEYLEKTFENWFEIDDKITYGFNYAWDIQQVLIDKLSKKIDELELGQKVLF